MIRKFMGFVFLVVMVFYGLLVSRSAQEGELLYPVKLLGEQIEYSLTPTPEGKVKLKLGRLEDTPITSRQASEKQDFPKLIDDTKKLAEKIKGIRDEIGQLPDSDKKENLKSNARAIVGSQQCALEDAEKKASGEVRQQIVKAAESLNDLR